MSFQLPNPPAVSTPAFNIASNALPQSFWIEGGVDSLGNNGCQGVLINPTAVVLIGQYADTNLVTVTKRTTFGVATDLQPIGFNTINGNPQRNPFWSSPTTGLGAFYLRMIFGVENVGANPDTWFAGLGSAPANINTVGASASTTITDFFGLLKDRTDTNWQFCRRTGSGGATKVSLGLAPTVGQVWIVEIVCPTGAASLRFKATRMLTASTSTVVLDQTVTTVLPTPGQSLGFFQGGVAAGTGNTGMAIISTCGQQQSMTLPTPIFTSV